MNNLDIANAFSNFFATVVQRITASVLPTCQQIEISQEDYPPRTDKLFCFKPISNVFVYKHLVSVKPSQSTGLDGIPVKLLKDAAPRIGHVLAFIANFSLRTDSVPDEWKLARVTPLFKDGDHDDMENYCPTSVLPVGFKILERTVQLQLVSFLEENSLFSPRQCGFRKHYSTEAAVAYLTDCIRRNMDDGLFAGAVHEDFRKAFGTIDH